MTVVKTRHACMCTSIARSFASSWISSCVPICCTGFRKIRPVSWSGRSPRCRGGVFDNAVTLLVRAAGHSAGILPSDDGCLLLPPGYHLSAFGRGFYRLFFKDGNFNPFQAKGPMTNFAIILFYVTLHKEGSSRDHELVLLLLHMRLTLCLTQLRLTETEFDRDHTLMRPS